MGESKNGILYFNGTPVNLSELPEITFDSNVESENTERSFSPCQSFSATINPIYPKMSRKKFIRNLVNRGYSKKDAKWLAWYCHDKKIPYGRADSLITFGLSVR